MSENSKIEWTDHTFNPWEGCQKVGPGCDNCYAEVRNARFSGGAAANWGPGAPRRRTSTANWRKPLAWNAAHDEFFSQHGRRQRVFCASLADVFDNAVDPQWRADLFRLISSTPNLDWLLLTKRIGNVQRMLDDALDIESYGLTFWADAPWPNVWIGATITSQVEADRDIPKLLSIPASVRFLSMEPLLGHVDLQLRRPATEADQQDLDGHCGIITTEVGAGLGWVIAGGESGRYARPMHPAWARDLRDQCAAADVPFHFKQHGEWHPSKDHDPKSHADNLGCVAIHVDGRTECRPAEVFALIGEPGWEVLCRVGKRAAGRLLDGMQHDGYPNEVAGMKK